MLMAAVCAGVVIYLGWQMYSDAVAEVPVEEKIAAMVNDHDITQLAYEKANQIVDSAQQNSREIRLGANQYADDVLADVEKRLNMLLNKVHDDRVYFNNKQ